ncbi:tRNA (adenosine(37)-N6)-threonylcarbamoyltransferase complex ATPase subunit type 1 TsaE [Enemella evansiae]|uniref:tRNA (adenosine(37)-N6)-threonylcarbamoyltransferase complex ATPase subunit type 1 TsaE n=1 Tax=Enemella evansiae TaxID=2016499 RepID=UPI0010DCDB97|nr:tRNA (adenosine(37)-N6)-threonylcarbamoyltransferase complex ATPase subunit type 1 TsaE [Enemella evansiae]TDO87667.1 tRNA threonylcarbamoyladenosine biosynthesis protein TsaE [Enemella evansiae]
MEHAATEPDGPILDLAVVEVADAAGVVQVIHAAFGARAQVDPPPPALSETAESVAAEIARGTGVVARVDGQLAGVILLPPPDPGQPGVTRLQRVSVHPAYQRHGVATAMVEAVCELATELGYVRAELFARKEFPQVVGWWRHRGFEIARELEHGYDFARELPLRVVVPDAEAMRALGVRLAAILRPGDLLIATGDLGAGKTTLTQGIGAGLGVTEPVISPTFVLSRVYPTTDGRPELVHVDAYRLGDAAELDDIDLDADTDHSVTVVEWGAGLAEQLADERLEIEIRRGDDPADETREVWLTGIGPRWVELRESLGGQDD